MSLRDFKNEFKLSILLPSITAEMGIYLEGTRTASVIGSRPSTVYRLSLQSLREMRENDPLVAALFHEGIADNNRAVEALMD